LNDGQTHRYHIELALDFEVFTGVVLEFDWMRASGARIKRAAKPTTPLSCGCMTKLLERCALLPRIESGYCSIKGLFISID